MAYSIDGPTKTISLTSGTTTVSVRDLWSRWVDWFLYEDNSKYDIAFTQVGGNEIDLTAGTFIPIYLFLQNDWKIRPQEADHTLNIGDGILVVEGGGDPFVNTLGSYVVRINYSQPVQAITVSTGGSGGSGATPAQIWSYGSRTLTSSPMSSLQVEQLKRIYQALMLDPANPVLTTPSQITFDDVIIDLTGNPETSITGTRQP